MGQEKLFGKESPAVAAAAAAVPKNIGNLPGDRLEKELGGPTRTFRSSQRGSGALLNT